MTILLVEDDRMDQRFIRDALEKQFDEIEVEVAEDGQAALDSLASGLSPKIIVTDLNMPRMDGYTLLDELKHHSNYRKIPTIVMSTSGTEDDIRCCYSKHANAYITKPDSVKGYQDIAKKLVEFWFGAARLPQ